MILPAWKATWPETTSPVDLVPCRVRALLDFVSLCLASDSRIINARDIPGSNPLSVERMTIHFPIYPKTREKNRRTSIYSLTRNQKFRTFP